MDLSQALKARILFGLLAFFRQWDLFGSGAGIDITVEPELPETSDKDAIPFTTAYFFVGSNAQPVDPNSTIPLQMTHSTIVPNTMNIPVETTVASQTPIGTPRSPRPSPSLPPGYNALNAYIPIPTQVPFRESGVFFPPGHNPVASFIRHFPTPPPKGLIPLLWVDLAQVAPPQLEAPSSLSLLVIRFTLEDNPTLGGNSTLGANPTLGGNLTLVDTLHLEDNPRLEATSHHMEKTSREHWPHIGTFSVKETNNLLGGNCLKLALTYPLVQANHTQALPIPFGVRTFNLLSPFKGTPPTCITP
jgi:hypothetical protein